jgi:GTP-binding protein HflX
VLINRGGQIERVVVGNANRIYLPDLGRSRAGQGRLRGLRWIETDLRGHGLHREDLADLQKLRFDYLLVVGQKSGGDLTLTGAHLVPSSDEHWHDEQQADRIEDLGIGDFGTFVATLEAELATRTRARAGAPGAERAVIVAVGTGPRQALAVSAAEMKELCQTAGVAVVETVVQRRQALDHRYLIGQGKLEEIVLSALQQDASVLVFDRELTPAQMRSLATTTDLKILDRTQLILDIFAQHAKSLDGKLQVELAQLKYSLPRLSEMTTAMSRLTGGIGGRGPGETKNEINRRRARDRLNALEKQIDTLSRERENRRKLRNKNRLPVVSIVGYTNAGKSTLLNALTRSDVLVENKLFATLDTTSRRLRFPEEREVIVTDTVGFIRDLPKDLRNAFRATLEELSDADVLLHVIDVSDGDRDDKAAAVDAILGEIGLDDVPTLRVWNKQDSAHPLAVVKARKSGGVVISATTGQGLPELLDAIRHCLWQEDLPS